MDKINWSEDRFNEIAQTVGPFLKNAGFKQDNIHFVPISGLEGINLTKNVDSK